MPLGPSRQAPTMHLRFRMPRPISIHRSNQGGFLDSSRFGRGYGDSLASFHGAEDIG